MEEVMFSSLNDLYKRLLPALKTRKNEIVLSGFNYVMCEDIFNFLKETKWTNSKNLTLYEMVEDILACDAYDIDNYLKTKMKTAKRELIEDNSLL